MSPCNGRRYRIEVEGSIDPNWSARLGGMTIARAEPGLPATTVLTGRLADQSALSGVLDTLLALHLQLVSAEHIPEDSLSSLGPGPESIQPP